MLHLYLKATHQVRARLSIFCVLFHSLFFPTASSAKQFSGSRSPPAMSTSPKSTSQFFDERPRSTTRHDNYETKQTSTKKENLINAFSRGGNSALDAEVSTLLHNIEVLQVCSSPEGSSVIIYLIDKSNSSLLLA